MLWKRSGINPPPSLARAFRRNPMLEALGKAWKRLTGNSGGPVRVVMVDDSAFIRVVVSRKLDQLGRVQVVGNAASGQDALAVIREYRPDVVLLDLEMPNGSGIDLLEKMTSNERRRCILFTGFAPGHEK